MRFFINKNGYNIYRCPSCGLAQTDLKRTYESFVNDFYTKGYFTGDKSRGAYVDYVKDKQYTLINLKKVFCEIETIKPSGSLLDIGCAMGYFVSLSLTHGYDAFGLEPSSYAYSAARKKLGSRIERGIIETATYGPNSFDIVTLFDVFEHVSNPKECLYNVHRFLRDDGIVVIATGDSDSLLAKLLKRRWTFYTPPQHLFFFNKQTILTLLRKEHFEPLRFFRVGKVLSLQYVLHLAQVNGESRIATILDTIIQRLKLGRIPVYLPVGDNIVVIARKI